MDAHRADVVQGTSVPRLDDVIDSPALNQTSAVCAQADAEPARKRTARIFLIMLLSLFESGTSAFIY
jgi:hypothetical protein